MYSFLICKQWIWRNTTVQVLSTFPVALPLWHTTGISDLPYSELKGQLLCSWFEQTTKLNSYCQNTITLFYGYVHSPLNLLRQTGTHTHPPPKTAVVFTQTSFNCLVLLMPFGSHRRSALSICSTSTDLLPSQLSAPLLLVHWLLCDSQGKASSAAFSSLSFTYINFERKICTKQSLQRRQQSRKTTQGHSFVLLGFQGQ